MIWCGVGLGKDLVSRNIMTKFALSSRGSAFGAAAFEVIGPIKSAQMQETVLGLGAQMQRYGLEPLSSPEIQALWKDIIY